VKLKSSTNRLIAAMLLIFLIGFLSMSAHSSSHAQLRHRHFSQDKHQVSNGDHDPGHHDASHHEEPDAAPAATEHTHSHNPLDHTHDIPLRTTIAVTPPPTFFRDWIASVPLPPPSAFLRPLERPPKSPSPT
jgi:hypothetical protein